MFDIFYAILNNDSDGLIAIILSGNDPNVELEHIPYGFRVFGKFPIPILNLAASTGSISCFLTLLEYGASLECFDSQQNTVAHAAAFSGSLEVLSLLLENNFDLWQKNSLRQYPIHIASMQGNFDFIKRLKANSEEADIYGNTPLIYACEYGHFPLVSFLIKKGAAPDHANLAMMTPLTTALNKSKIEIAKLLIKTGKSNPDFPNLHGKVAVHFAAECGFSEILKLLFHSGANFVCRDSKSRNLLHFSVKHTDILFDIISLNIIDLNQTDSLLMTPLHLAAKYGIFSSVQCLLENGADPLVKDMQGNIPLFLACKHNHIDVVQLFLCNTGGIDQLNVYQQNLLHVACRIPNFDMLNVILLAVDFNLSVVDLAAWTPLHYAASKGSFKMVELLLNKNADREIPDKNGKTPFDIASKRSATSIMKILQFEDSD